MLSQKTKLFLILISLCVSLFLVTACSPLGNLVYQGETTNLGPFQPDGVITGSIVGERIALSEDGQILVSEDWRRRTIYRQFGGNWPQVYALDYRPSSGPADDSGTPWFVPKLDETGSTLLTSDRDKLRTFSPQGANGQDWQAETFLSSSQDSENYRYSKALLSANAQIVALSHKTSDSSSSFGILDKDITIWEIQSGTWTQIATIDRLADSGATTNFNAPNFGLTLLDINRDGSKILVSGPNGAFVHTRTGDSWQDKVELNPTMSIFSFNEEGAISGNGNRIAVEVGTNTDSPRVLVFDSVNGAWQQSADLKGQFKAMSSDGQTLVVQNFVQTGSDFIGTPQSQGFLEVLSLYSGSWQKITTFAPSSDRNSYKRVALSSDGSVLAATFQDPPFTATMRLEIYKR